MALVLVPAAGLADAVPSDLKTARDLFVQAEQDEDAGRWQDAEEKLQRVAQVKLTAGVRYHIALCEERIGRLAQALEGFEAARDQARNENARDVLRLVAGELAELTPRVPRIVIHTPASGPDVVVTLDGAPVAADRLGAPLPVNPGDHRIEVLSTGRRPAKAAATLQERDAVVIDLPLGDPLPPPGARVPAPAMPTDGPTAPQAVAESSAPSGPSPPLGHVAAGATTAAAALLVGAGVGAFFVAGSAHDDAVRDCAAMVTGAVDACDSKKRLVRGWDWAAVGAWSAGALTAAGAVFLWTRPSARASTTARLRLSVGPAWVGVEGSF